MGMESIVALIMRQSLQPGVALTVHSMGNASHGCGQRFNILIHNFQLQPSMLNTCKDTQMLKPSTAERGAGLLPSFQQ